MQENRTSVVCTTVRGPSLNATASSGRLYVREIGIFNTTAVAVAVGVGVATAAGTIGAALTEVNISDSTHTILGVAANTHTADATITGEIRQASLGAAIGAGVIWTWGPYEFVIDEGTANGAVITCPSGTGQHLDFYFEWDE